MITNTLIAVGNEIKTYRLQAGLSQEELSKISGVERAQLSRIESGEVLGVTYATVEKIFNSLGRRLETKEIKTKENIVIHPFVKWAGGKTQLLDIIQSHMPNEYNRYFEPFVGGGALLYRLQPDAFSINDANSELISVYECFQDDELFNKLKEELVK